MDTFSIRICQDAHANALALNKDNTQIAVAGRSLLKVFSIENDGFVEVCNMRAGKNHNLSYSSNDVAWSALEGSILATAATNGVVSVWDLSRFGRQKQLLVYNEHERTAHSVAFHNTEPHFLISGSQDGTIKRFDTRYDKAVTTFFSNSAESVRDVKFSPQNQYTFAAVSESGTVQLWDTRRPDKCTVQYTAHSEPIYTCDWHPTEPWLATGSRDKQIKIWKMDSKPSLEYTIHTIAVVGRVRWRPEKKYHIASCALVVDYSIYVYDIRRNVPYACFYEHTNVTTGIQFKTNDPYVLFSTSKDSTIYRHSFKDADRSMLRTNPQGASINFKGDLLYAYKLKPAQMLKKATYPGKAETTKTNAKSGTDDYYFHLAKSNLLHYAVVNEDCVKHKHPPREYECLKGFAKDYRLFGAPLAGLCDHNAKVARSYGKHNIAMLWLWVKSFYGSDTKRMPSKLKAEAPTSSQTALTNKLSKSLVNQSPLLWDEGMPDATAGSTKFTAENETGGNNHGTTGQGGVGTEYHKTNANNPNSSSQDLSFREFLFGDKELTIDCVAKLRNGFLYTSSYEMCKEFILPNSLSNCNDLNANKHQTDLIVDTMSQEQQSPERNTPLLKVSSSPPTIFWEPHNVLADCLTLQTEYGDVQTSVCILIALGSKRSELPIDVTTHENWLLSYIDLLHRHELWNEATEVLNYSWLPTSSSATSMNEQSTAVHINCGTCSKPLSSNSGPYCSKCKSAESSRCSVCRKVVRGLFAWCQTCSHGGHLQHIREWFAIHSKCPACDHLCMLE